jgi:hypothetical protein
MPKGKIYILKYVSREHSNGAKLNLGNEHYKISHDESSRIPHVADERDDKRW